MGKKSLLQKIFPSSQPSSQSSSVQNSPTGKRKQQARLSNASLDSVKIRSKFGGGKKTSTESLNNNNHNKKPKNRSLDNVRTAKEKIRKESKEKQQDDSANKAVKIRQRNNSSEESSCTMESIQQEDEPNSDSVKDAAARGTSTEATDSCTNNSSHLHRQHSYACENEEHHAAGLHDADTTDLTEVTLNDIEKAERLDLDPSLIPENSDFFDLGERFAAGLLFSPAPRNDRTASMRHRTERTVTDTYQKVFPAYIEFGDELKTTG